MNEGSKLMNTEDFRMQQGQSLQDQWYNNKRLIIILIAVLTLGGAVIVGLSTINRTATAPGQIDYMRGQDTDDESRSISLSAAEDPEIIEAELNDLNITGIEDELDTTLNEVEQELGSL